VPAVLLVALGGVVGALSRVGVGALLPHEPGTWAWSTLAVNALGAAALCAMLVGTPSREVRLLLGTGLLGGFTTFSAFAVDAVLLAEAGRVAVALGYVAAGVVTLVAGAVAGASAARAWRR
jgi:CrcB protein